MGNKQSVRTKHSNPTLDWNRICSGSVIELTSIASGKTLMLCQDGSLNGNGSVGLYAGCLGPKTRIWGRATDKADGRYYRGTILSADNTQVYIQFDNGETATHAYDAHDRTAVVADVNPDYDAVQVNSRVIAPYNESTEYYTGHVKEFAEDEKFKIQFDHHSDDQLADVNKIRMLPGITPSDVLILPEQSKVHGRWTNNKYYPGKVTKVGNKIDIKFDDGDKIQHDRSDIAAVIPDCNPIAGTIQNGSRVIAKWEKNGHFYLGKVEQVDCSDQHCPKYSVHFDDGDRTWSNNLDEIRPVPLRRYQVGCIVWGRSTNDLYYHGRVTNDGMGEIHVTFDNGEKISHYHSDISAVLKDVVPCSTDVSVGSRVIAANNDSSHYYKAGKVTDAVDSSSSVGVLYDDGEKGKIDLNKVRLLPVRVDEAQFRVVICGDKIVALNSIAYPEYFLGIDNGITKGIKVKTVDDRCQFCVDRSDDHKYISLEFRKFPGYHVGVDAAGNVIPPKHVTLNSDETFFETKLLFEP